MAFGHRGVKFVEICEISGLIKGAEAGGQLVKLGVISGLKSG